MNKLRIITWVVIAYLTFAFMWWARLLFVKNEESFRANIEVLKMQNIDYQQTTQYILLKSKHQRQHWMIVGEGCTFICLLFFGLWQIQKSYRRELGLAQQRRNFLLSITHELKSPITGIQLVFETFLRRNLEKPMVDKLAQNGLKDTVRLQQLVEDLLLAARLEENWEPNLTALDLPKMAETTISRLKIRYPDANLQLIQAKESLFIEGDATAISSVFQNLLENAVKYSPENSPILLRFFEIGNKFGFAIEDQGIGISELEKSKIFQKFYRVGSEETRETKGTGLGLFIVQRVVTAHDGKITVERNLPRGTIFTVTFLRKK
jgi:signal transduction histidine kinase